MDSEIGVFGAVLGAAFGLVVFFVILMIALYVVSCLGMMKMLRETSCADHAWMIWIPILNLYVLGELFCNSLGLPEWVKWVATFGWAIMYIPLLGIIGIIAYAVGFLVLWIKFLSLINASAATWIVFFLFSPAVGFLIQKDLTRE